MSDKSSKVQVTFDSPIASILSQLAKQEHKTIAGLARELILEALERREDVYFSALADERDTGKQKTVKHKDAWKK